jgi:hypothetical protein
MSTTFITLICIIIILSCILSASIYFNVKHGILILRVQDTIEESLDILDAKYSEISSILEKPVFFDSHEVRQAISDISSSRDAILSVAKMLTETLEENIESGEGESA